MSRRTSSALVAAALVVLLLSVISLAPSNAEGVPAFRWPWAGTEGWRYTQGFHSDYALDFQPQIAANCDVAFDPTHTIRPVAAGTVTEVRMRGSPQPAVPTGLVIDHGDGWSSYYTHLANVPDDVAVIGAQVGPDTDLGNPSCYTECAGTGFGPPCATGRHIHFQIRKNGSGSGILEAVICGWTVGADSGISRNGLTFYPDESGAAPIFNAYCPAGDPVPTPLDTAAAATETETNTSTPTSTSTPTPTRTPTPTSTPTPLPVFGDANCDLHVTAIDATVLLQYSAGFVRTLCGPSAADANNNGRVDPIDAQLVLQFSAGVIGRLPPPA
jgi:murein DD-endopeptidase MepM/ murein hydrolase activator NlpD